MLRQKALALLLHSKWNLLGPSRQRDYSLLQNEESHSVHQPWSQLCWHLFEKDDDYSCVFPWEEPAYCWKQINPRFQMQRNKTLTQPHFSWGRSQCSSPRRRQRGLTVNSHIEPSVALAPRWLLHGAKREQRYYKRGEPFWRATCISTRIPGEDKGMSWRQGVLKEWTGPCEHQSAVPEIPSDHFRRTLMASRRWC